MEEAFKLACVEFCFDNFQKVEQETDHKKLVNMLVGEDLEWLDSLGFLFLQNNIQALSKENQKLIKQKKMLHEGSVWRRGGNSSAVNTSEQIRSFSYPAEEKENEAPIL